jgi:hypothetical protein
MYVLLKKFPENGTPVPKHVDFNTCHKLYLIKSIFGWYIKRLRNIFVADLFQNIVETTRYGKTLREGIINRTSVFTSNKITY